MTDISKIDMSRIEGLNDMLDNCLNNKQDISNLSQTLDDSTTKYPSNKAVKDAFDAKDNLPDQSDNAGKFLTTDGTNASWDVVGVIADQHSGFSPKKIWTGTEEQYDQIATKSSLTLYYVQEDGIYLGNNAVVDYSAKRHQVVSVLPVNPDPDTFYYITEE